MKGAGAARGHAEGANGKPGELVLDLPAVHSAGRMGRQILRRFAAKEGVRADELETLELVAGELLSNAVDHGGGQAALELAEGESGVLMHVELVVRAGRWTLSVADQGGGDPEAVRPLLDPDAPPDLGDERGRGFFLITQLVDRLIVERSADGLGLVFRAEKRFAGEAAP